MLANSPHCTEQGVRTKWIGSLALHSWTINCTLDGGVSKGKHQIPLLIEDLHLQNALVHRHGLSQWLVLLLQGASG